MPTQFAKIYDKLTEFSVPYMLPPNWSWLEVAPDCRVLTPPNAALERLTQEFDAPKLLESGVVHQPAESLALNPLLTGEDRGFIVLRNSARAAFDVITAGGCLSGAPPVFKIIHDHVAKQCITASHRQLFGTFSMADTALLRSLGVAAAPAAHLQHLQLPQLQRLLALDGGAATGEIPKQHVELPTDETEDRRGRSRGQKVDEAPKFALTLVAGSISEMNDAIPAALRDVAQFLESAQECLGFSWHAIKVWRPRELELTDLWFRQGLQSPEALRNFFATPRGNYLLSAFRQSGPPTAPTPAQTYVKLLRELTRPTPAENTGIVTRNPHAARQKHERFTDEHFFKPLIERALGNSDPEERARLMQMAGLSRLYHGLTSMIFEMQGRCSPAERFSQGQFLPKEIFRQLDSLCGRLQKLIATRKTTQRTPRGRS
jgi:hypothetical protein